MKNFLLYFAIFILVILLLLPVGLRLFAKDIYKKIEKKNDIIETLSCNKLNETLNISYLNSEPYNLSYNITGNFSTITGTVDESQIIEYDEEKKELNIVEDLKNYGYVDYNTVADVTTIKVDFKRFQTIPESLSLYAKSIDDERDFLAENSFSCAKSSINK